MLDDVLEPHVRLALLRVIVHRLRLHAGCGGTLGAAGAPCIHLLEAAGRVAHLGVRAHAGAEGVGEARLVVVEHTIDRMKTKGGERQCQSREVRADVADEALKRPAALLVAPRGREGGRCQPRTESRKYVCPWGQVSGID